MDLEQKVDDVRDMLHEMKPVVSALARSTESLDVRMRAIEIKQSEHDVKLLRTQSDVDGLGRKVRAQRERHIHGPADSEGSRWIDFLEVLAAVPKHWHVILTLGSMVTTAVMVLIRHWPR